MDRSLLTALVGLLIVFSSQAQHSADDHHNVQKAMPGDAYVVHGLALNDGERWMMDQHTRNAFSKMKASFDTVVLAEASSDDLQSAASVLRSDLDVLIQGCTMTGAAHDELHKYLIAYMPAVDRLANTGGKPEGQKVAELLALFPRYFQ